MASAAASASTVRNGVLTGDIGAPTSRNAAAAPARPGAAAARSPVYVPHAPSSRPGSDTRAAALSAPLMRRQRTQAVAPPHRDAVRAVLSSNTITEADGVLRQI